jgi:hypothetical protein
MAPHEQVSPLERLEEAICSTQSTPSSSLGRREARRWPPTRSWAPAPGTVRAGLLRFAESISVAGQPPGALSHAATEPLGAGEIASRAGDLQQTDARVEPVPRTLYQ